MRILLVEDEAVLRELLGDVVRRAGYLVRTAPDAEEAIAALDGHDVLVTDVRLPGMDGLALAREARARNPGLEVIVLTGAGSIPSAVEAIKGGARAYLTKPFDAEELLLHLRDVAETIRLREAAARGGRGGLVGTSAGMRRAYAEIDTAAASDSPVLVQGETGTGKELAARAIHDLSRRRRGPFVAVNLGALPRDVAGRELFGHERGAFTGAHAKVLGRFTVASGGTLFLDEIDTLALDLQPALLRAIETGEVHPLGAERPVKVDVRIVAATNAPLAERARAGAFREDLYWRLNVLRVEMPPLRDRPEDIPLLVRAILDDAALVPAGEAPAELALEAIGDLLTRPWPGNVRELRNVLHRAALRAAPAPGGRRRIEAHHLDPAAEADEVSYREGRAHAADAWARRAVRSALVRSGGNVSEAARLLKMGRGALLRVMTRYGLRPESVV